LQIELGAWKPHVSFLEEPQIHFVVNHGVHSDITLAAWDQKGRLDVLLEHKELGKGGW
jgi:hypothetical protein